MAATNGKNIFIDAEESARLCPRAREMIDHRTGSPKGLLQKTEEEFRKKGIDFP